MASVRYIEGVGLIDVDDGKAYVIAELQMDMGSDRAKLFRVHSGHGGDWIETELRNPLPALDREWVPGGVVSLHGKLWWYDLSWGIVSVDPFIAGPELTFCHLPGDRALQKPGADSIHNHRLIATSQDVLCYLEIITRVTDLGEFATFTMWALAGDTTWETSYTMHFEELWNDDTYRSTHLNKDIPQLVAVCPWDPRVTFFVLDQSLFSVNVSEHKLLEVEHEPHKLVQMPWPTTASCRYVLSWELPHRTAEGLHLKKEKDHISEEIRLYAKYCRKRAEVLKGNKEDELCHMCLVAKGRFITVRKIGMLDHCEKVHKTKGFLCEKTGCVVRAATLGEAGLHHHYCHGQRTKDWWRPYLEDEQQA